MSIHHHTMSDSTPLIDIINKNATGIIEVQAAIHAHKTQASAYFHQIFIILATITLVLSVLTISLIIATYVIVKNVD